MSLNIRLYGREDRVLDRRANGQSLVDKVPRARLEQVGGGHILPATRPALTARFIDGAACARLALAS